MSCSSVGAGDFLSLKMQVKTSFYTIVKVKHIWKWFLISIETSPYEKVSIPFVHERDQGYEYELCCRSVCKIDYSLIIFSTSTSYYYYNISILLYWKDDKGCKRVSQRCLADWVYWMEFVCGPIHSVPRYGCLDLRCSRCLRVLVQEKIRQRSRKDRRVGDWRVGEANLR